jgi:hypothetical protein
LDPSRSGEQRIGMSVPGVEPMIADRVARFTAACLSAARIETIVETLRASRHW